MSESDQTTAQQPKRGKWWKKWSASERERQKRRRRRRYARDPAFKAKMIGKLARLLERKGFTVRYGPSGWPFAKARRPS